MIFNDKLFYERLKLMEEVFKDVAKDGKKIELKVRGLESELTDLNLRLLEIEGTYVCNRRIYVLEDRINKLEGNQNARKKTGKCSKKKSDGIQSTVTKRSKQKVKNEKTSKKPPK
jgi:hypothetical protein